MEEDHSGRERERRREGGGNIETYWSKIKKI